MNSSRRNGDKHHDSNSQRRRKQTAERLHSQYGTELNDQDFGVSQLTNNSKQQQRRSSSPAKRSSSTKSLPLPPEAQLVATPETLEAFADDVGSLWCGFGAIPVLDEPPSPMVFLRDYVSCSRPCIIRNALMVRDARRNTAEAAHAPGSHLSLSLMAAVGTTGSRTSGSVNMDASNDTKQAEDATIRPLHLSLDDIVDMDPNLEVVVDATPDGNGDCVRSVLDRDTGKQLRLFVTPEQRRMTLNEFRTQLREGRRQQRQQHRRSSGSNPPGDPDMDRFHTKEIMEEQEENNDLQFEEELYDEFDGKRVFALKGSGRLPSKKSKEYGVDDIFASCAPMTDTLPTTSCNPLNDMEDLIMPIFNELLEGRSGKQDASEPEVEKEPPPPPPPPPSVLYYSQQNDCFRTQLPSIYEATRHVVPSSLAFAEEAFGTGAPEAVNLWMGDERAVSSMHKDPYENMFYVAGGEKLFDLCPPADAPFLYEQYFMSGMFDSMQPRKPTKQRTPKASKKRHWSVKTGYEDPMGSDEEDSAVSDDDDDDDDIRLNDNTHSNSRNHSKRKEPRDQNLNLDITAIGSDVEPVCPTPVANGQDDTRPAAYVKWIEADVSALTDPYYKQQQMRRFPLLKYAHPIHQVRVQAGELLYLPALWFHRVTQSRETIGLNYWYNMNFSSPQWCYFQLLNQLQLKEPSHLSSNNRHHQPFDDYTENNQGY